MNKDSLLKRHYSSLERPRRTRKGFRPRNTLLSNSGGSSPPNELIDLDESRHNSTPSTVISSPKTKVNQESSQKTRNTPSKIVIPSSPKHKKPQLVPDAFNILININHCRLDEDIDYYTLIEEVTHKENGFKGNNIMLNISKDGNFLFFTKGSTIIEQGVINMREQLKHLFINERPPWTYLFIELAHDKGYFCVKFTDSNGLQSCLKKWKHNYIMNDDPGLQQVLKKYRLLEDNRDSEHSQYSPKSKFNKISPLVMYDSPRRSRRSLSGLIDSISYKESDTVDELQTEQIYETPADFSPLLQHKFADGKVFTITQSDLKTLYNNDWINDNIMDFFINFEIENAVKKQLFSPDQIYAFNSFFFSKLVSKNFYQQSPGQEETSNIDPNDLDKDSKESSVDYYGNIKRWISRIDLFSYPYIIMPVNENSHWYCCLIKRMPQMLEFARKRKNHLQKKLESLGLGDKASDPQFLMETLEEAISQKDDYINSFESEKKESKITIYVFDSLSQKHNNIHAPIKSFIIGACLDKFDIPLVRSDLSFRSAKVPKQRNFNDCGIHVLYNVRKWLSDCDECFRVWNSPRSNDYRTFFVAQERNPLRREFIDILLSLHRKVHGEGSNKNIELDSSFKKSDISDDDDVELLEVKDLSLPNITHDDPKSDNLQDSNSMNNETKPEDVNPLGSLIKAKGSPVKSKDLEIETTKSPIGNEDIKSNKETAKFHKYSFVDTDKPGRKRNETINNKILRDVFDNEGTSTMFRKFLNFVAADEDQSVTKDEIADLKVLKHRVDKLYTNDEETLNREFATISNDFQYFKQKRSTQLSRPKDEELVIKHTEPREKVRKELDAEIQDLSIDYSSNSEEFDFSIGSTTAQSPRVPKKTQRNESLDPWIKANKENRQDMSVPVSRLTSNSFNHLIKDSTSDTTSKGRSSQIRQQSAASSPPRKISGPKKRRID